MDKRKVSRRAFLRGAMTAATGAVVAACTPKTEIVEVEKVVKETVEVEKVVKETVVVDKREILYWHFWTGHHELFVNRIVDMFERDNPGIEVDVLSIPGGEYLQKFLASVAAGRPPDVQIISNWQGAVYSFAAENALLPLDEIGDPDDVAVLKNFMSPMIYELGSYEGKLYGVATWTQAYGVIHNAALLREAGLDPEQGPQTLSEYTAMAEQLTKYDDRGNITQLGGNMPVFWQMWGRFGGQLVSEDGRTITANHEGNLACLEWAVEMAQIWDPTKVSSWQDAMSSAGTQTNVFGGRLGMERTGPWRLGGIKEFVPDMEYTVSPDPLVDGVNLQDCYSYGDVLVVPKGTKEPQAAFDFVGYLCGLNGEEAYVDLFISGLRPHIPTSEKLAYSEAFRPVREGYPGYEIFLDNLYKADRVSTPPKIPVAQFYVEQLQTWESKAKLGEVTPGEALDTCTKEVQAELDRWYADRA
jgi:multiple sugar transport system substrate-binding protein